MLGFALHLSTLCSLLDLRTVLLQQHYPTTSICIQQPRKWRAFPRNYGSYRRLRVLLGPHADLSSKHQE